MSTHLRPDPTPRTAPEAIGEASGEATSTSAEHPFLSDPQASTWLRLSAELTEAAPVIADREDLTVALAHGVAGEAPGCFIPALATIALDAATLTATGIDPDTCHPERPSDRDRYPATWGVFTHECAHARHSHWHAAAEATGSAALAAATVLEESRIEAVHLRRRPADRHWLRAAATALVLPEITDPAPEDTEPHPAPPPITAPAPTAPAATAPGAAGSSPGPPAPAPSGHTPPRTSATPALPDVTVPAASVPDVPGPLGAGTARDWEAAHVAGLVLARVDADVLEEDETRAVSESLEPVLGQERMEALRQVWQAAHGLDDGDAEGMLGLGARWCAILGVDPTAPAPSRTPLPAGLRIALEGTLAVVSSSETIAGPSVLVPDRTSVRAAEARARKAAEGAAQAVFAPPPPAPHGHGSRGATSVTGTRLPTGPEQAAARALARSLRRAAARERTATTETSTTPPGRLRMRHALAADAQRAAGAVPTAEPFTRTTFRHVPSPPLRVGIACDVSGSMCSVAAPLASTAWILARATGHVTQARAATVIYGRHVRALTHPGSAPTRVSLFEAHDATEQFTRAVDALDAALDLSRPGAARVLVNISDGYYTPEEIDTSGQRLARLRASGCAVVWIGLSTETRTPAGITPVILTDPATAPDVIARAVTDALRRA